MKLISSRTVIPIAFLLAGLFYLFQPVLSGSLEVLDASLARETTLPIDWLLFSLLLPVYLLLGTVQYVIDIIFASIFAGYLLFAIRVVPVTEAIEVKRLAATPLVVILLLWLILLPLGPTFQDRRINSFPIGGWIRLHLTGHPDEIKREAQELLASSIDSEYLYSYKSELPPVLSELGGWAKIDHKNHLVLVGIGSMSGMSAEFGYLIHPESPQTSHPGYLSDHKIAREWQLTEGIYLVMR
jgi:hypothetical protein